MPLVDAVASRAYRHLVGFAVAAGVLALMYAAGIGAGLDASPVVRGTVIEPLLHGRVVVRRDARGVPHVVASSETDLFFAQGFVEASDRLFQMDITRRYATGTLAEVLGPKALPIDEEQRYFDIRDVVARQWLALDSRERAATTAFTDGVNAAMRLQPLPVEFWLLLYRPKPWKPQDSLAVSLAVSIALADSWHDVLTRNDTWRRYGPRQFDRYYPLRDARYDVTVEGAPAMEGLRPAVALAPPAPAPALRRRPGSNAWAAGSERTTTGRALLANDPHLDLTIPGLWYLEDLRAPGMHVAGASIPGVPGVLLGHNERIAWGATNSDATATTMFYPKRLSPRFWKREVFHVRFSTDATRAYYRAPYQFGVPDAYEGDRIVLVRWPLLQAQTTALKTFLALDRAGSTGAAISVLSAYAGTAENFVVADVAGIAAYHLAGGVPDDPAWGRYVHRANDIGSTFRQLSFGQLPAVAPSRSAIVVSANNKMYSKGYPYRLSAVFDPPYRAYRIAALLRARSRYDAAYFARMQLDTVSPVDAAFARIAGSRLARDEDDPAIREMGRKLAAWNGDFSGSSRVATVEHALRARLQMDEPSLQGVLARLGSGASDVDLDLRSELYGMQERPAAWAAAGAVQVQHPLAPLRFGFLNGANLPGDGDEYTIHLQEPGFAQSFRAVWDVGNWDAGGIAIPSGESGEPGSPHYEDLRAAWIAGRLQPLPFSDRAVRTATREVLVLEPRR